MSINLLCQDPTWLDISPIDQVEPEGALVQIMYSLEYSDAMGYFRAIAANQEHSERVLDLTLRVIRLNPAHYTVWQYRFKTLLVLQKSLTDELQLMTDLAEDNMKSYQVWHHRLLLLTHIPASSLTPSLITSELAFISHSLLADQKNYHTWAYRQFVLTHFSALLSPVEWEAEQRWVDSLLRVEEGGAGVKEDEHAGEEQDDEEEGEWEEIIGGEGGEERHKGDVRNNSAWGHRWFLAFGRVDAPGPTAMQQEIDYTKSQIALVPNNASSWNYLRGIHTHFSLPFHTQSTFVTSLIEKLATDKDEHGRKRTCAQAVEWLGDQKEQDNDLQGSKECFETLKTLDPIRRLFWAHRQAELIRDPIIYQTDASAGIAQDPPAV